MAGTTATATTARFANLKLSNGPSGQVLTATVPNDISEDDFNKVGSTALKLIKRLTGCNCMSGRISFVVEDNFADVIKVDLNAKAGG
jgi:hypothetical protein